MNARGQRALARRNHGDEDIEAHIQTEKYDIILWGMNDTIINSFLMGTPKF